MQTKFGILDKIVYFNTASGRCEEGVIKGIQIVPTDIETNESGEEVLKAYEVLYRLKSDAVVTEREAFSDVKGCVEHYQEVLGALV